jgi:hypothetical protein
MKLNKNQEGFFTMIICLLLILAGVIFFAYNRVKSNQTTKQPIDSLTEDYLR